MKNITNLFFTVLITFFISLSYIIIKLDIIPKAIINVLAYEYYFLPLQAIGRQLVDGLIPIFQVVISIYDIITYKWNSYIILLRLINKKILTIYVFYEDYYNNFSIYIDLM